MKKRFETALSFLISILILLLFLAVFFSTRTPDTESSLAIYNIGSIILIVLLILLILFAFYVLMSSNTKGLSIFVAIISSIVFLTLSKEFIRIISILILDYDLIGRSDGIFAYFATYRYLFTALIVLYFLHITNFISLVKYNKNLDVEKEVEEKDVQNDIKITRKHDGRK
ncbi:MAG: hypothetical protein Q4B36_07815 [Tissierellia bacterium]|nr:hypothetical protein [Tissierellia bacterium]